MENVNLIQQNNLRLLKNTIAMYGRTLIVMIVSLYSTRLVLKILGVEAYGVYNVVGTIVVLFTFLNGTMAQSVQRFITVEIGAGSKESVNKIFNMSLIVQLAIAVGMLVLCETVGLFVLNKYLNLGDKLYAANWVFQFSIITACVNIFRVPYESMVVANERMTFFAMASVGDALMKLGILFLIPITSEIKLILYAGLLAAVALAYFVMYVIYCRKMFETCNIRSVWDKDVFRNMMSFSGWNLSGSVTSLATHSVFGVLLNIFYGVVANAALGIMNQMSAAVIQFINNFQTSFRPQIVKACASGEEGYFKKLILTTSKFSYLLIFIPALLLMVNMPLVLKVWLGDFPDYTVAFCRLILVCCMFDALTGAYFCAIAATGRIKRYQLAISASFTLDLIISAVMMIVKVNPEYILYSRIATRGVLNMVIGLEELKKLIQFDVSRYHREVTLPLLLLTLLLFVLCEVLMRHFEGWRLLWISFVGITIPLLVSLRLILSKSERNNIKLLFNKLKG